MAEDEDIAALVIDNGSGMCKGMIILEDVVLACACLAFGVNEILPRELV